MKIVKKHIFYYIFIVILGLSIDKTLTVSASDPNIWVPAQIIPFYDDVLPPLLIADQNGIVHAFNSQPTSDGPILIYYRQWRKDLGWSRPINILLPDTQLRNTLLGVLLDNNGLFHLIYYGGTEDNGKVLYTHAWASEAEQPEAWSAPVEIATGAGPYAAGFIAGNGIEDLYVLYTGQSPTSGVYAIQSEDNGTSWSESIQIQTTGNEELTPQNYNFNFDPIGNLHAVWSFVDQQAFGQSIFYSRRDVENGEWNPPQLLAAREGNDYATDYPTIIYYNNELIVMYGDGSQPNGNPPTRWMRISRDAGNIWSDPSQPFPQVGENGFARLLVDGNNQLHIILANRVGDPAIYGMWHGTWEGEFWSNLELITPNDTPQALASGSYASVNFASEPTAVISQGNTLLVTWWHDMTDPPFAGYSYMVLDEPELPRSPLPTHENSLQNEIIELTPEQNISNIANTPSLSPEINNLNGEAPQPQPTRDTTSYLTFSIFISFIFIVAVIVYRIFSQRS